MTTLEQAARMALEAIEYHGGHLPWNAFVEVRKDLRSALEQPQQEPVAWLVESKHGNWAPYLEWSEPSYLETQVVTPLYTSPTASKPWVGLNAKDLAEIPPSCFEGAIWADAKLKEKNNG